MSYLLFMDESGHDHQTMPYEVRGGIALHAGQLWPFIQSMKALEQQSFGVSLQRYGKEIKGARLLDKDRFKWASQTEEMTASERQQMARMFLAKGASGRQPVRREFAGYGQASLYMADGIFRLCRQHRAVLLASMIPRGSSKSLARNARELLRKDHVFLMERFFYLLQAKKEYGLIVMDEVEKSEDRRFVRRLETYFQRTSAGRVRARWVVPVPIFVSSDMSLPVQAADVLIYCVNWGFRGHGKGLCAPIRCEIAERYANQIAGLQHSSEHWSAGQHFVSHSVFYVADPYCLKE